MVRELADTGIPVAAACRVLNVFPSGYYEWLGWPGSPREMRNKEPAKLIVRIRGESRGTHGWPRVRAELVLGLGEAVNRERAARLVREAGLQGARRRKGRKNLASAATGEDLVRRQFAVAELDRLWLTEITGHPAAEGKACCAAVTDACSRRITGWSIDVSQKSGLVIDAIGMAILRRRPEASKTILHSGHGTQYTSWAFGKRFRDAGLLGSMEPSATVTAIR